MNRHPDIEKLKNVIYNDIKRFSQELPPPYSKEQCDQKAALEKALAITMVYYLNYIYEIGYKDGKWPEWKTEVGRKMFGDFTFEKKERLPNELFEI